MTKPPNPQLVRITALGKIHAATVLLQRDEYAKVCDTLLETVHLLRQLVLEQRADEAGISINDINQPTL